MAATNKTYTVKVRFVEEWVVDIVANSSDEAKDLAMIEYDKGRQTAAYVEETEVTAESE